MKDLGPLHHFLGVKVVQDQLTGVIWIGQPSYTYESLVCMTRNLAHTDCACINISGNFFVKLSGHYQRTRGLCMYTTVSGKYTETN